MQITRSFLNAIIYIMPFDKVSITTFWPQIAVNQSLEQKEIKPSWKILCNDLFDAFFVSPTGPVLSTYGSHQPMQILDSTAFEVSSMKAGNFSSFYQYVSPTGTTKQEAFDNMWNKYSTANAADGEDWGELSLGIAYTSGRGSWGLQTPRDLGSDLEKPKENKWNSQKK